MSKRTVSGITLTLLLISMLTLAFNIQPVEAEPGTWTVDGDGPAGFHTIQEATNSANSGGIISHVTGANKTKSEEPSIWVSPNGSLPTLFNETERSYNPFSVQLKYQTGEAASPNMVYVLVDSSIYDDIEASLVQYVTDIETSGLSISVYSGTWGTPEETRTFLQQEFSSNLTGCLLVGDIPEAWYEMDNPSPWGHEEFPIDLYYMDLDGIWTDSDVDGIYDGHEGDVAPEIWVGRLKASTIWGDEASLLNNHFNKNHRYRTGTLSVPQCALVYVDDDWVYWADGDKSALGQIYEPTILVKDRATTNAEDYKNRLPRGYEWVHLRCHGWSGGHVFKIPVDEWGGYVYSWDYRSIDPPVLFYQLFVCSAARYIEYGYLGGTCVFTDTGGLLAIGSTKTGSMRYFSDFYGVLSEGDNIGDAFKKWFIKHGETDPKWFYGLTILGDPLLKPLMSPPSHDLSILELEISPYPEPGAPVLVNTTVFNMGTNDETNITVQLLVDGSAIDSAIIDSLKRGTSATVSCTWTPVAEGTYNVSYHVVPVPGENLSCNNILSETVSVQVLPDILIIDDNDGGSWVDGTSLPEFKSALTTAGFDYGVWDESFMGNPLLDFLTKFKLVVWTCGDYWGGAVDPTDAVTLESYLTQGGNILLEGEDIGYDHDADSFMVNVAHAIYEVDGTGASGLTVTDPTHPVTQGLPANFAWLTDPPYDDGVTPTNGGFEVIRYTDTSWTAVTVFDGTGTSNGSIVYYAFPIYCLGQPERDTLIINSVNWFLPRYTLTVYSVPSGVTFTVDNLSHRTPWSEAYYEDTSVNLEMPETHTVGEAKYYWNQWSDGNTSRSRTVTMTANTTLTAYYTGPYYDLTVASSPITGITFTINGTPKTTPYTEWLLEGSYTLIMPETHNGYVWSHWLEDEDTNRTKTITLPGTTWTGVFVFAVQPHGPEAEFEATPDTALTGEPIKFDASASSPGWNGTHEMPIVEYRWDFGDGNKTTTYTPTVYHSFSSSGIYYVALTVYAPGAAPETDTISRKVTIISVPVGGYSLPIKGYAAEKPLTPYLALVAILTVVFTTIKRKTHKRTKRP